MKRFENFVVVITGAANGIGEASAYRFAEEGSRVACLDLDQAKNEEVAKNAARKVWKLWRCSVMSQIQRVSPK